MRASKQRDMIYAAIAENCLHPTADMVYHALKPEHPALSLGTVYRNLNLLCRIGKLRRIQISGGADRFDGSLHPHYHAVCEKCGRVFDVDSACFEDIRAKAERENDFRVTGFDLVFQVVCRECAQGRSA